MKILKAELSDAKNIAALAVQVWLDTYAVTGIRDVFSNYIWTELTPESFSNKLNDKNRELYKLIEDEHLIGLIELNYDSSYIQNPKSKLEIDKLYIQENFCNRGIGGMMIDFLIMICKKKNLSSFWLSVYEKNARAIKFYEKHNFSEIGEIYFELGNEKHRNIVYEYNVL